MRFALSGILALLPFAVAAQTATDNFDVRITIAAECRIITAQDLDFGSAGVLTSAVDAAATLQVACTNSTPYSIGLDQGLGVAATTTTRKMTSVAAQTINYRLFRDSGHTANWGNTIGTDTVSGTGNGATQSYTVYGRVLAQATPAPGSYTDTVTITVTY